MVLTCDGGVTGAGSVAQWSGPTRLVGRRGGASRYSAGFPPARRRARPSRPKRRKQRGRPSGAVAVVLTETWSWDQSLWIPWPGSCPQSFAIRLGSSGRARPYQSSARALRPIRYAPGLPGGRPVGKLFSMAGFRSCHGRDARAVPSRDRDTCRVAASRDQRKRRSTGHRVTSGHRTPLRPRWGSASLSPTQRR